MNDFWNAFRFPASPVAKERQTIVKNGVRISVLTPRLIRIERQNSSVFCDEATQSVVCRDLGEVNFTAAETDGLLIIQTGLCEFCYSYKKNKLLYVITENGVKVTDLRKGNLKGTCRTLDNTNGRTPIGDGILSVNGVSLLDDGDSLTVKQDGTIAPRKCKETDLYIFAYGHDYKTALRDYFRLTGMPPLIPRFALGNWWSRYKAYTQEEYKTLIQLFEDEDIPLTVATIDMDWHWVDVVDRFGNDAKDKNSRKNPMNLFYNLSSPGWTGYSWNTELFPQPKEFLAWLKNKDLKVTMNIHPASGCKFFEDSYKDFAAYMGIDPSSREQIPFDITDKKFTEGYFRFLHHPHERDGVDFWWIDWQQGKKTAIPGLDPLWALNHYHYYDRTRENLRPLILSRFAGAGSHRYPLGFSGDSAQTWASLDFQPYFTATAANIGYTWWSHDIGGHHFGVRDDELYLRWIQFGVFSPVMRLHSTSNEFMGKEPWKYRADVRYFASECMRFRHRMIPYTYSMNRLSHTEGRPLCEPVYYEHPDTPDAYRVPNEYYFGTELLVCPITQPANKETHLAPVKVYLPEGRYTDIFSDRIYQGGQTVTLYRDEGSIPVLAREGSVIPLYKELHKNDCSNPDELELMIYRGNSSFTLYEDDGETLDFENGVYAQTEYAVSEKNGELCFRISPAKGDLSVIPEQRGYLLSFRDILSAENVTVLANGSETAYTVSAAPDRLCVQIEKCPPETEITVTLHNVTVRKNKEKKELLIELFSKLQGANLPKQKLYAGFVLSGRKSYIPPCIRGAVKETDALFY